jgi:hypothetical protein
MVYGSTATASAPGPPCAPRAGPHSTIMTSDSGYRSRTSRASSSAASSASQCAIPNRREALTLSPAYAKSSAIIFRRDAA